MESRPVVAGEPRARERTRAEFRAGSAFGSGLVAAFTFGLAVAVPPLGLLALLSPFPLMLERVRGGSAAGWLASLLAAALLAALLEPAQGLKLLIFLAIPALLIAEGLSRGRGLVRGCAWAFAWLAFQIGLGLFVAGPQLAQHLLLEPVDYYRSPPFLSRLEAVGWSKEMLESWAEQARVLRSVLEIVYPAVFLIMGALIVLVNAALLRGYLARRDPGWLEDGEFERIRWPLALPVVFILSGVGVVLPPLRPAAYNVLLLVGFFFALQGLAVVAFFVQRLAGPPFLRFAVGLLVVGYLWTSRWAPPAMALLGLFDIWFDFRRHLTEPPAAGPSGTAP